MTLQGVMLFGGICIWLPLSADQRSCSKHLPWMLVPAYICVMTPTCMACTRMVTPHLHGLRSHGDPHLHGLHLRGDRYPIEHRGVEEVRIGRPSKYRQRQRGGQQEAAVSLRPSPAGGGQAGRQQQSRQTSSGLEFRPPLITKRLACTQRLLRPDSDPEPDSKSPPTAPLHATRP